MHPSWITIDVKLKFYQMFPLTVAHHVKILTISFLIVINKGNNKITELRTILQRESQNS